MLCILAQPDKSSTNALPQTSKDFDELYKVCTYEDNWCGWADYPGKTIIYGYMKKEIEVPEGADELEVTIQLCSRGYGEGLAVDIDSWTPSSSAQIIVEEEVKEEKIPKLSHDNPHYHHHSYYKYEHGESFSHTFNISGKERVTLTIRMVDDARLDFGAAILTFRTIGRNERYGGVCYGPFRDNEDPDFGIFPTYEELQEDIKFISNLTHSIRTYGISKNPSEIPIICQEEGVVCYPGAWISPYKLENEKEIQSLIRVANQNLSCVKGLIVGNEVLLRGDVSKEELIEYIKRVKTNTSIPVGTAELWHTWLEDPQLAENVDFILVHIHPYWEGIHVNLAANHVLDRWKVLKAQYPEKEVIVGETGWPTQGAKIEEAVPTEKNQKIFLSKFLQLAEEERIQYFYFDVFDEKWKKKFEGPVGAHWGLYYANGTLKPLLKDLIPKAVQEGLNRRPREIPVITAFVPLVVYYDAGTPENRFYPSGWMGDLATLSLDYNCNDFPYSGDSCIKIIYSPEIQPIIPAPTPTATSTIPPSHTPPVEGWAGIYWQYPVNNWGDYPGYNISEAKSLTFWARGKNGGEMGDFKIGGIHSPKKPYHDSFGPLSTEVITLTKKWKKYTINLSEQNLSMVIGGFCWVTNRDQNPEGCTIYLDEISIS
jgi:exo-beta-1,3-glucanase (GH17 family)